MTPEHRFVPRLTAVSCNVYNDSDDVGKDDWNFELTFISAVEEGSVVLVDTAVNEIIYHAGVPVDSARVVRVICVTEGCAVYGWLATGTEYDMFLP